jgi:hypothetical protein
LVAISKSHELVEHLSGTLGEAVSLNASNDNGSVARGRDFGVKIATGAGEVLHQIGAWWKLALEWA